MSQSSSKPLDGCDVIAEPSFPYSRAFNVGDAKYTASGRCESIELSYRGSASLATVIYIENEQVMTGKRLHSLIEEYVSFDDVFRSEFLQGVIFATELEEVGKDFVSEEAVALLKSYGNQWFEIVTQATQLGILAGVFVVCQKKLHEAYKLYEDVQGAFMTSLIRGPEHYLPLALSADIPATQLVAVPSRLRQISANSGFLSGLRLAVKDNFHIKGIRTTVCNYAYSEIYGPRNSTAACISNLEKKGAYVLGTTRMAAFAATEEPLECIDYQAPWNPRGDGHQSPAGSSSGSGAAIASYKWLDVAIGSDTSGSGRRPAHWNGCFAHRPTHGLVSVDGFVPSFPLFDTPTFFARDIYISQKFVEAWYGDKLGSASPKLPFKVVVPTEYMQIIANTEQKRLIGNFITDLCQFLDTAPENVSLEKLWDDNSPSESNGRRYSDYMKTACRDSFFYDDYHSLASFRDDYKRKFSKHPYISPPIRWQWNLAATITEEQRNNAIHSLSVFKKWFSKEIMEIGRRRTIVVHPIENISPRYRDEATTSFNPVCVPMLFLSPILEGPECTVPIGQVEFASKVSGRAEFLPVAISLLSAPGSDLELLDLIKQLLEKSKRPTKVEVGRFMFESS